MSYKFSGFDMTKTEHTSHKRNIEKYRNLKQRSLYKSCDINRNYYTNNHVYRKSRYRVLLQKISSTLVLEIRKQHIILAWKTLVMFPKISNTLQNYFTNTLIFPA